MIWAFGLLDTKFFSYDQPMILIQASRSKSSQGQSHLKVKRILRSRSFQNQIVSAWISIPKQAVGFQPECNLVIPNFHRML